MYYTKDTKAYLNGEYIQAYKANSSLFSQTLHYGNGVFEGIRSYNTANGTKIFKAKEHYDRLLYSAKKSHIELNYTTQDLIDITYKLLEINDLSDAYIRPLVYLGANMALSPTEESNLFICVWKWDSYLGNTSNRVMISKYERPNPKSCDIEAKVVGHYINSILASTEAKSNGYDEALLLDQNGYIAEGAGSNFFFEKNGKLYTPQKGSIFPGITRSIIIDLAKELEYETQEGLYTPDDLRNADSAFFVGTAVEVVGIDSINYFTFKKEWKDSIGYKLSLAYNHLITENSISSQDKKLTKNN